jgi:hypothetical protein
MEAAKHLSGGPPQGHVRPPVAAPERKSWKQNVFEFRAMPVASRAGSC